MSAEDRRYLLSEARKFCEAASKIPGVEKISLVGSLTTEKQNPKDADLLITVDESIDLKELASAGRKIKGKAQSKNLGADIFLCDVEGNYIGRTCSYRECHVRVACRGNQCHLGTYLCDDLQIVDLSQAVVSSSPLDLWPVIKQRRKLPEDVEEILVGLTQSA